jgi:hypothetical protein
VIAVDPVAANTKYAFEAYHEGPVTDLQNALIWVDRHGVGGTTWGTGTVPAGWANGTTEGYSEYRLFLKKDQQIGKLTLSLIASEGDFTYDSSQGEYLGTETDKRDSISIQLYGAGTAGTEKTITRNPEYATQYRKQYQAYNDISTEDTGLINLSRQRGSSINDYVYKYTALILGKNITLKGGGTTDPFGPSGFSGYATNPWYILGVTNLIALSYNAVLIMEDDSKITGYYDTADTRGSTPILLVYRSKFYMKGGTITGNTMDSGKGVVHTSNSDADAAPYIKKTGGTVTGNSNNTVTKQSSSYPNTVEGWN